MDHFLELVEESDEDKNGKIDFGEWEVMGKFDVVYFPISVQTHPKKKKIVKKIKERVPMAGDHLVQVKELFQLYDSDADNSLSLNELLRLLEEIGSRITSLPATAQVAAQQGKYLGKKLHKISGATNLSSSPPIRPLADEAVSQPFKYFHLGTLAYVGNAAVFDFGQYSLMGGLIAMYAWRSVYWNEQVSTRTRALLMIDWIVR